MDDRQKPENEAFLKNLETLVTARTEQLGQVLSQNYQLLEFLKRLQTMESSGEIHAAVQTEIEKFQTQMATSPPSFGGSPGEPVPQVDPEDFKTLWEMGRELEERHPGQQLAIDSLVAQHVCKPGADIQAVGYRVGMLSLLKQFAGEQLTPWTKDGQFEDSVFRAAARMPIQWMEVGVVRRGFPFNVDEFIRLCGNPD